MAFSDSQVRMLAGKLHEKHVHTREQRGTTLSYIEGWHAIDEANRIFGFDGWDRETIWAECLWQDARSSSKSCAYAARVRIRVRAGDTVIVRDGSGVGHGSAPTIGEAHEKALKEAETDATKRALTTFGNLFGLALYDKGQNGVKRRSKPDTGNRLVSWVLLGPKGEFLGKHETAEAFCSGLREAIATASNPGDLESLWARNDDAVRHLRTCFRDLKTEQGVHYSDILDRIYRQRREALQTLVPTVAGNAEAGSVDKSALPLSVPRRARDQEHLAFIGSLPCLICARTPAQAHHLRFVQPRSMGSKPSDEWTVPLCLLHHRALHDAGNEEKWWQEHGVEARAEAERLWRQRHDDQATPSGDPPASQLLSAAGD
jgi:DNA recombination protein Rad52